MIPYDSSHQTANIYVSACSFASRRESAADSAGEKERLNDWKDILSDYPWQKVKKAPFYCFSSF